MDRTHQATAVEAVIKEYIAGTVERDVERLQAIFHPNAVMSGYLGPNKLIGTPAPFFAHLQANEHGPGYRSKITHIQVTGRTASATLLEENLYGMSFVNEFHLLDDDGRWTIVSKLFHHD